MGSVGGQIRVYSWLDLIQLKGERKMGTKTDMADPIGQVQPWMSHKTNGIDLGQGLACKELHEYIDFYS